MTKDKQEVSPDYYELLGSMGSLVMRTRCLFSGCQYGLPGVDEKPKDHCIWCGKKKEEFVVIPSNVFTELDTMYDKCEPGLKVELTSKWQLYESVKQYLCTQNLTQEQYEEKIRTLSDLLDI